MYKFFKLFLVLLVLSACSPKEEKANLIISTDNGDVSYNVEEAITVPQLEKGLMFRESLPENAGMIFDLSNVNNKVAMWMKDTKIPLDMIFINGKGEIFFIFENAVPMSEDLIIAPEPATFVLELNAGTVQKHNIKVGDKVKHHLIDEYMAQKNSDVESTAPSDDIASMTEETTAATSESTPVDEDVTENTESAENADSEDAADDLSNIPDDSSSEEAIVVE